MYGDKYQQLNFWLGVISHTSVAFRFFHSGLTKHGESCWSEVFSPFFFMHRLDTSTRSTPACVYKQMVNCTLCKWQSDEERVCVAVEQSRSLLRMPVSEMNPAGWLSTSRPRSSAQPAQLPPPLFCFLTRGGSGSDGGGAVVGEISVCWWCV